MIVLLAILWSFIYMQQAVATVYYVDNLVACTGTYNPSTRDCTGNSGNSYTTINAGIAPLVAGDTLHIRSFSGGAGVWNAQIDLATPNKTGTIGNPITIAGYPGETVTFRYASSAIAGYGTTKARGNRGYITFRNMRWDGVSLGARTQGISMDSGNHHFVLDGIEILNHTASAVGIDGDNIQVVRCNLHDNVPSATGNRPYGIYFSHGSGNVIEFNDIHHNAGGGVQITNETNKGVLTNSIARYNRIYENNDMASSRVGGFVILGYSLSAITGLEVYGNIIYRNGTGSLGVGGGADGISINDYVSGAKIHNNVIYNNQRYGVNLQTSTVISTDVHNNIVIGSGTGDYRDVAASTTASHNACTSGTNCGTSKITIAALSDCLITAGDDYRLKQGTNMCRNAGISVSTRPSPVGGTDVGSYEQGEIVSAAVSGGYIDAVFNVMTLGVAPTTGISGLTITCVGCTGTPVVSTANIKSGTSDTVRIAVSGLASSGSCTISIGVTNATDSLIIGWQSGLAQGLNSVSSLSVSGTCVNTGALAGPAASWSHFSLNEGSGTVASDDTGNVRHGTVSAGVTWVNNATGTGVTIPTDLAYKQITSTFGSGVNPSTQSFAKCIVVNPTLSGNTQKVVFSSGTNGASQRWYAGWVTVSGQAQWGIGIQGSGFTTGSEFVVSERKTLVCIVSDSVTDTATLWVDGVKGAIAGKSVKTFTSYVLTNTLIVGNDGTNTVNNGGFTVYEVWIWNTKPTDQDMNDLYAALSSTGTIACLAQTHVQWQGVFTDSAFNRITITPKIDGSIDVVKGGAVAVRIQYDSTGCDSPSTSPFIYYSTDGVNFAIPVPQSAGVANIYLWGNSSPLYINNGQVTGCIDATGLTATNGTTIVSTETTPTFSLLQDRCRSDTYIIGIGAISSGTFWLRVKGSGGADFANGYAAEAVINVVPPQANVAL